MLYISFNFTKQVHVDSCILRPSTSKKGLLNNKIYVSVKLMLPINILFNTFFAIFIFKLLNVRTSLTNEI